MDQQTEVRRPDSTETPNSKLQTPKKYQAPNLNLLASGIWRFGFGSFLESSVWCLVFFTIGRRVRCWSAGRRRQEPAGLPARAAADSTLVQGAHPTRVARL